jgi:hypothetical protein
MRSNGLHFTNLSYNFTGKHFVLYQWNDNCHYNPAMMDIVRTSQDDWLEKAIKLYAEKKPITLIDDAMYGLKEKDLITAVSLLRAAKSKNRVTWKQITGLLAGLGITGAGVWMVAAAIADPEPTTKLGLLIAGGVVLALTGSFGTFASLGVRFFVTASSPKGHSFNIKPEGD